MKSFKKTQTEQVIDLFLSLGNPPLHYKEISHRTGIIVHNVRRITGQNVVGKTTNPIFKRVSPGVYELIEKSLLVDDKNEVSEFNELIVGNFYVRRDLHEKFGGNRQRGIVNLPGYNAIFLLNANSQTSSIYEDGWSDGKYYLSGEGLKGDQKMTHGNKTLKENITSNNPKRIFLFEPLDKSKKPFTHVLESELKCIDYETVKKEDIAGSYRNLFKFIFEPIDLYYSNIDEGISDEKEYFETKIVNKEIVIEEDRDFLDEHDEYLFNKFLNFLSEQSLFPEEYGRVIFKRYGNRVNVNVANKEWQVVLSDKFNDESDNLIYLFSDDHLNQIGQIENIKRYIYFKNGYFYGKGDLGNFPIDKY